MALKPHWLDDVFARDDSAPSITNTITGDGRFRAAVERAVVEGLKAKEESAENLKKHPGMAAPSPGQAARERFIEVLGTEIGNG